MSWRSRTQGLGGTLKHLVQFIWHVVTHFFGRNNGLLLAGAVAYNSLLSVVPLLAIILVVASNFFDPHQLMNTIEAELALIVPGQADAIAEVLWTFLNQRDVIGGVGFLVLLFFSSIAFRILENAIAVIFGTSLKQYHRSFWVSALLPYLFITVLGIGLLAITVMTAAIDALPEQYSVFGLHIALDRATSISLYVSGLIGLVLLFTSLYTVMPVTRISFRRALVGGIVATALWEIVRYFLVWYFTNISLVNVVYGSLATVVIVLLTMEVAAVIILLGAQVIAELERNAQAGVPWYAETAKYIEDVLRRPPEWDAPEATDDGADDRDDTSDVDP